MRLRADTFTSALALAVSAFILLQGRDLGLGRASDPGSGFILFWTGIIMTALSAVLLVQSLAAKAEDAAGMGDAFAGLRWGKVVYVVALMVLYASVVEYFGFILSTAALLLVLFKTVEPQSWRVAIIGSALTTLGAWAVFVAWLGTQLPVGILFLPD
jgi:putative tricarboxylic transport membrane protein